MNCLVILDKYLPNLEANALCIDSILQNLNQDFITIICRVDDPEISRQLVLSNKEIVPIYFPRKVPFFKLGLVDRFKYIFEHIFKSFFGSVPETSLVELFYRAANKQIEQRKYDLIITVLNPIEAVAAGKLIKEHNSNSFWLIYDLDTASNCSLGKIENFFRKFYMKKVVTWEKSVFEKADLIIHLDSHKKHFLQNEYRMFKEKMLFQGVPLLNVSQSRKDKNMMHKNKLIYSGTFYNRLREPDVLLNIIEKAVEIDSSVELDVYTKDDSVENIKKKVSLRNIRIHGYVAQDKLNDVIDNSVALISIGNKTTVMFPSKILSYVSALKPIIHIYQNAHDPVILFLKQYPSALLLDGRLSAESNAKKMIDFLRKTHREISADRIEYIYRRYTGMYCAKEICDYMFARKGC